MLLCQDPKPNKIQTKESLKQQKNQLKSLGSRGSGDSVMAHTGDSRTSELRDLRGQFSEHPTPTWIYEQLKKISVEPYLISAFFAP